MPTKWGWYKAFMAVSGVVFVVSLASVLYEAHKTREELRQAKLELSIQKIQIQAWQKDIDAQEAENTRFEERKRQVKDAQEYAERVDAQVCEALNVTCNGQATDACRGLFEPWTVGWSTKLTKDQAECVIGTRPIPSRDDRAAAIRRCGTEIICR